MFYRDLRSYIKLPDILSISGLFFSILSIFSSIKGAFVTATIFILISTFLDYSDGRISRKLKRKGRFGLELDNLCDVVLYLISISIFGYAIGLKSNLAIVIFIFFITAGILRLARFSIVGIVKGYYEGLPVGYSVIIPILYFIFVAYEININHLLWFYFIPSFLMISIIKVKKF